MTKLGPHYALEWCETKIKPAAMFYSVYGRSTLFSCYLQRTIELKYQSWSNLICQNPWIPRHQTEVSEVMSGFTVNLFMIQKEQVYGMFSP